VLYQIHDKLDNAAKMPPNITSRQNASGHFSMNNCDICTYKYMYISQHEHVVICTCICVPMFPYSRPTSSNTVSLCVNDETKHKILKDIKINTSNKLAAKLYFVLDYFLSVIFLSYIISQPRKTRIVVYGAALPSPLYYCNIC